MLFWRIRSDILMSCMTSSGMRRVMISALLFSGEETGDRPPIV